MTPNRYFPAIPVSSNWAGKCHWSTAHNNHDSWQFWDTQPDFASWRLNIEMPTCPCILVDVSLSSNTGVKSICRRIPQLSRMKRGGRGSKPKLDHGDRVLGPCMVSSTMGPCSSLVTPNTQSWHLMTIHQGMETFRPDLTLFKEHGELRMGPCYPWDHTVITPDTHHSNNIFNINQVSPPGGGGCYLRYGDQSDEINVFLRSMESSTLGPCYPCILTQSESLPHYTIWWDTAVSRVFLVIKGMETWDETKVYLRPGQGELRMGPCNCCYQWVWARVTKPRTVSDNPTGGGMKSFARC